MMLLSCHRCRPADTTFLSCQERQKNNNFAVYLYLFFPPGKEGPATLNSKIAPTEGENKKHLFKKGKLFPLEFDWRSSDLGF